MSDLDLKVTEAFDFYKRFILDHTRDKSEIYQKYGFNLQGSVGAKDWEVFAAILLDEKAKPGHGTDLEKHEVKSAILGSSYEYQYHKNQGLAKLEEDKQVDHIFIARSADNANIEVWRVSGAALTPIFDTWQPQLQANYQVTFRQRFRRSITHHFVTQHGQQILKIVDGLLVDPVD